MELHPVLPKLFYFLFFLSLGVSSPYYSVLLATLMPSEYIGWTMGILQGSSLLMAPVWGMLADVSHRPRLVLGTLIVLGLGTRFLGLFFLPQGVSPFVPSAVMIVSELVFCGSIPILDSLVCQMLRNGGQFGHQRLFGAISWGLAAPSFGFVYTFLPMKWGLLITWVLVAPLLAALYFAAPDNSASSSLSQSKKMSFREAISATRLRWQQICFLSCALFSGFCNSSIGTFLFLHIENIGGNSQMMGLSVLCMILSEIPFMYFSNRIAAKIGTFTCVQLGLVAYTLRMFGYQALGTFVNPWWILAIEPLHGITFGIFYSVCVAYIAGGISNEMTRSTWQGIFSGLLAVGRACGSIGGGYLFLRGGGVLLFRVGAAILAGATVLFFFVVLTDRGFIPSEPGLELKEEQLKLELMEVFSADEELIDEEDDL